MHILLFPMMSFLHKIVDGHIYKPVKKCGPKWHTHKSLSVRGPKELIFARRITEIPSVDESSLGMPGEISSGAIDLSTSETPPFLQIPHEPILEDLFRIK